MSKFYLTTAIPYVNAAPHVGHALEFVQADCIARYHKLTGDEVCLLSGGDENAVKNVQAAILNEMPIQEFVDKNSELFKILASALEVDFDVFQKGSDLVHHYPSSQKLWKLCESAGDIYKKSYSGLYCVGCETFYTKDELNEKGECFEHPGKKIELVNEENYFFRLSKYQKQIVELITSDKLKIFPISRKNEILEFLKHPLTDISISRTNSRAKNWGVPVPGDETQRIYVWFDALNIYQSGIGFGWDEKKYHKWWPADLHVIGKGILRFHAVYWPAFLLSSGLKLPKSLFVHGYFTVNGQKMSKTLGNIIDPNLMINKYGADALRYYLLREISSTADGDFSEVRFKELYNADLANGLGNLVARIAKLSVNIEFPLNEIVYSEVNLNKYHDAFANYRFQDALACVWDKIKSANQLIDEAKPWTLPPAELKDVLKNIVPRIYEIGIMLQPFLPDTAGKIITQFKGPVISVRPSLFPRVS